MSSFGIGNGVEWTGTADGVTRFGVVMSAPYRSSDAEVVDCTVDTLRGDPLYLVPVEVARLRERHRQPAAPHPALRTHGVVCE